MILFVVGGVRRVEIAVKTDYAFEIRSAASHFKDNAAAETIADSGYFVGVNKLIFFYLLKACQRRRRISCLSAR